MDLIRSQYLRGKKSSYVNGGRPIRQLSPEPFSQIGSDGQWAEPRKVSLTDGLTNWQTGWLVGLAEELLFLLWWIQSGIQFYANDWGFVGGRVNISVLIIIKNSTPIPIAMDCQPAVGGERVAALHVFVVTRVTTLYHK